jgi:hypothetical protein
MGTWSIVLAETCSEVVGSKRITFPSELPISSAGPRRHSLLTKCNVAVAHPRNDGYVGVGSEASDFVAGDQVPDDCRLCSIVRDDEAASALLTDVVDGQQLDIGRVHRKSAGDGEGIVMRDDDLAAVGEEEHAGRGSTREKVLWQMRGDQAEVGRSRVAPSDRRVYGRSTRTRELSRGHGESTWMTLSNVEDLNAVDDSEHVEDLNAVDDSEQREGLFLAADTSRAHEAMRCRSTVQAQQRLSAPRMQRLRPRRDSRDLPL